jgi:ribose transport system ATP-binding protein
MESAPAVLEMRGIDKAFSGVPALQGVDFTARAGEVMALLGENGAGKSTLMKVLFGEYEPDHGSMVYQGQPILFNGPREALNAGVCLIHQELNLIPNLTVAENLLLGREPRTWTGRIDRKKLYLQASKLLERLGIAYPLNQRTGEMSVGQQQMVEIAKALSYDAQIFIMDEPTGALTTQESERLFEVVESLRDQGKAVIYISHRLPEIFRLADRVTVLRDGKLVGEQTIASLSEDSLIRMMVGRELSQQFPYVSREPGRELLAVMGLSGRWLDDVTFTLREGEIVGLTGLMGAGRTELGLTLFGAISHSQGSLTLNGEALGVHHPSDALRNGIVYISEDRKGLGLHLGMTIRENMTLPLLRSLQGAMWLLDSARERLLVETYMTKFSVRASGQNQKVGTLSGGNQQKVALAKGLLQKPRILIVDEPTRGIDVGAKRDIYDLLNQLKLEGLGILMISSEMPEVLGLCDRVLVMHGGTVTANIPRAEATQERILKAAITVKERIPL